MSKTERRIDLPSEPATTGSRPGRKKPGAEADLPSELVHISSKRLGTASLIYAIAYLLDYAINRFAAAPTAIESHAFPMTDLAAVVAIPTALAVFMAVRSGRFEPRWLCTLGLVFEVFAAFGIAIQEHWAPWEPETTVRGISWICVWIVFFPIIVPTTTKRAVAASFAAATMAPVSLFIAVVARGNPVPAFGVLVDLFEPPYICAFFAPISAHILHRLGRYWHKARQLGSYELVERLGAGGMGEVWRARHQMLARPAAIKLIHPDVLGLRGTESAALLRQFEREAQATALLQSPHTIELYDFGVSERGVFFYVMELLEGLDLDTLVSRFGPMRVDRAIYLLRQVCHSLRDAHRSGLIHRDVKPANIYVCRKGADFDFVKVLDFGLVKALGDDAGLATTAGRALAGTPAFLPPELASAPDKADHRVDIYGIGCLAYWLLTARLVFEADSVLQMVVCHLQQTPEPPSWHTEIAIPPEIDDLVLSCLEKDPNARPESVEQVIARLDTSTPGWTPEHARRWWEKHDPVGPICREPRRRSPFVRTLVRAELCTTEWDPGPPTGH